MPDKPARLRTNAVSGRSGWLTAAIAVAATVGHVTAAHGQFRLPPPGERQPTGESLVAVQIVPSKSTVEAGEKFELAVAFRIEPQWHIYWRNSGASGMPTEVRVTAPEGFEVGELRWPTPRSFSGEEGITYGYADGVALFVPITAPDPLPAGTVELAVAIDWLVCRRVCLPGSARRTVTVNDGESAVVPAVFERIVESSRATIPRPLDTLPEATARVDGSNVIVEGPLPSATARSSTRDIRYFPLESPGVTVGIATVGFPDDRFRVTVPIEVRPENSLGQPLTIGGVVVLADGVAYEFMLTVAEDDQDP